MATRREREQRLARFPMMTAAQARDLARAGCGEATTHAGLRAELRRAAAAGFKLSAGVAAHAKFPVARRVASADAREVATQLVALLALSDPAGRRVAARYDVVGSLRRGNAAATRDIDILATVSDPARVDKIAAGPSRGTGVPLALETVYARGRRKASLIVSRRRRGTKKYFAVDLFFATPAERPFALYHHTGSRRYNIRIRSHAKARGLKLNQYGVFAAATGRPARGSAAIKTERDLAEFLEITYRPPAARER